MAAGNGDLGVDYQKRRHAFAKSKNSHENKIVHTRQDIKTNEVFHLNLSGQDEPCGMRSRTDDYLLRWEERGISAQFATNGRSKARAPIVIMNHTDTLNR